MPTYTTLHQDSSTVYDTSGTPKFRIVSSIPYVRPGDLPDNQPEVFVFQIVDATDPKQDKFLRVASIHDLSQIIRGRDPARSASRLYYLASSFTVDYNDVTTAINAKAVVQTRVDALIIAWIDYSTKFVLPTDFTMPAPEDTLVTGAKNTYYAAKSANTAKQAELATAIATFTESQAAAARASTSLTEAVAASTDCSMLLSKLTAFNSGYRVAGSNYRSSMDGLVTAVSAAPSNVIYDAALAGAKSAQSNELSTLSPTLDSIIATVTSKCATLTAAVQTTAQAKTAADTAAANAQTAQVLAQASATAAAAAEAAALSAVMIVCPDFDPNA